MQRGARIFEKEALPCSVALVLRFATCPPSTRGRARRDLCESAPMQRGAHFFAQKCVPMQRGAQSARRHFGVRALPCYVFQYLGLRRFYRFAALAFRRFVFRWSTAVRGHPFHLLESCFCILALWRFIFRSAALSCFRSWASPWVAFWVAGSGRARLTVHA